MIHRRKSGPQVTEISNATCDFSAILITEGMKTNAWMSRKAMVYKTIRLTYKNIRYSKLKEKQGEQGKTRRKQGNKDNKRNTKKIRGIQGGKGEAKRKVER